MKKYNKATLSIVKIENTAIMANSVVESTPSVHDEGFVAGARTNGEATGFSPVFDADIQ